MHDVLRDMLHKFVLVYIDDILTYSYDLQQHRHVTMVLHRLREHQLFLKVENAAFTKAQYSFLGLISPKGIYMDNGKVKAVSGSSLIALRIFRGF